MCGVVGGVVVICVGNVAINVTFSSRQLQRSKTGGAIIAQNYLTD